jgi:hypothetical protein
MVDFSDLASCDWNRLFVFHPYTRGEDIERALGFHWDQAKASGISHSDGVNLIVLVKDSQVVKWFDHPRSRGELYGLADGSGFHRTNAKFVVRLTYAGAQERLVLERPN